MKKFMFSLQKLKDYREQILERQKNQLGFLRAEQNALNGELAELKERLERKNVELKEVYKRGATTMEISVHKRYIVTVQQEIKLKEEQILQKADEIEKQLNVVIEATKDVSTLDNLQDKQLEEYHKKESKESERFIEEFVQNSLSR